LTVKFPEAHSEKMRLNEFISTREWLYPAPYCALINLRNRLRGKSHSLRPAGEPGVYVVEDGRSRLHICRRSRHNRSRHGVLAGVRKLAGEYGLGQLEALAGGILIDCGANVGELGVWAGDRGMRYLAFEPEELEARCCDLNNFAGERRTRREALWHTDTTLEFYTQPETADGSLIPGAGAAAVRRVPARRLDSVLTVSDLGTGPVILKVEAEGAEPEVLQGAAGLLPAVDFVTVDCGPERGPERKDTFVETNTLLADAGFRPLAANFKRMAIVYHRPGGRAS
jgi:FkbM family methyltransferase